MCDLVELGQDHLTRVDHKRAPFAKAGCFPVVENFARSLDRGSDIFRRRLLDSANFLSSCRIKGNYLFMFDLHRGRHMR